MRSVLLAGATGVLGSRVAHELANRGYRVRRLVRDDPKPGDWMGDLHWAPSLAGGVADVDAVISCAGASMRLGDWWNRTSFRETDEVGNRNLLRAAERTRLGKFVYVSLAGGADLIRTEYARAHEAFVQDLDRSGVRYTIVRPTGLFAFFAEFLKMARRGRIVIPGDGKAQTNPIHEADAARACVDALASDATEMVVGGPEVYSRHDIASLAFWSLGQTPKIHCVPAWTMRAVPPLVRLVNQRIAALLEFGIAVSGVDVVAPRFGRQKLDAYFRTLAAGQYGRWRSQQQGSTSSENWKQTTPENGSSPGNNGTKSSSATQ